MNRRTPQARPEPESIAEAGAIAVREGAVEGDQLGPIGPRLGVIGWARWAWRQLTSMSTALTLLLLLAVAAIPGSVFPQLRADPGRVDAYLVANPRIGPWLSRLGFFDVYGSPWFAAVYLLLFVSLIGCVLPRLVVHAKALRAMPPRTPARLERLPEYLTEEVADQPEIVLAKAQALLRARGYRVAHFDGPAGASIAAQRGYVAETGNLLFHLALVVLLVSVALGSLFSYTGQAIVVEGGSFANVVTGYDSFKAGSRVDSGSLTPFTLGLRSLTVAFEQQATGAQFGAPRAFDALVEVVDTPGARPRTVPFTVNHPIQSGSARVFLTGNGYAPVVTVRDGDSRVVKSGPVIFLPRDGSYASVGVIKVPDAQPAQLAFQGLFLPTAYFDDATGPRSLYPDLKNPCLVLNAYASTPGTDGLGLDDGTPQSVYRLDTANPNLHRLETTLGEAQRQSAASSCSQATSTGRAPEPATGASALAGAAVRVLLAPGETFTLPGGQGSITFDGVKRYMAIDVHEDPSKGWALIAALLALAGVSTSLNVRAWRLWVRALPQGQGRTVVEVAGLAQSHGHRLAAEIATVLGALHSDQGEK